jgi:hypothetical protein
MIFDYELLQFWIHLPLILTWNIVDFCNKLGLRSTRARNILEFWWSTKPENQALCLNASEWTNNSFQRPDQYQFTAKLKLNKTQDSKQTPKDTKIPKKTQNFTEPDKWRHKKPKKLGWIPQWASERLNKKRHKRMKLFSVIDRLYFSIILVTIFVSVRNSRKRTRNFCCSRRCRSLFCPQIFGVR